jgi:hypothetical protein
MSTFIQATVTINGRTFRAWVRAGQDGYSVVYNARTVQLAQQGDGTFVEVGA